MRSGSQKSLVHLCKEAKRSGEALYHREMAEEGDGAVGD